MLASPSLSVIIPVRNSPAMLASCLAHLTASSCRDYQVIVVDDGSTDDTAAVAAAAGVEVVRLSSRRGPAVARNSGAEAARGEILLFLDADVCVHEDTLARVLAAFAQPDVDAVFGSYDTRPAAPNFVSQYKNLFHHFVHQEGRARASTFWAGCGAVRRVVFRELGGFDAGYGRPCIEDIELGARLARAGRRVLLDPRIQVTHLKRWTLWGLVRTDVCDRGVPWTRLLLRERTLPNDLNLKRSQRLSALLAYGLVAAFALVAWYQPWAWLLPPLVLAGLLHLDAHPARDTPLPSLGHPGVLLMLGALAGGCFLGASALLLLAFLVGLVLLNYRLYAFFARERNLLFAALALPLHVLYYLYSGAALAAGVGSYVADVVCRPFFPATGPCKEDDRCPPCRPVAAPSRRPEAPRAPSRW